MVGNNLNLSSGGLWIFTNVHASLSSQNNNHSEVFMFTSWWGRCTTYARTTAAGLSSCNRRLSNGVGCWATYSSLPSQVSGACFGHLQKPPQKIKIMNKFQVTLKISRGERMCISLLRLTNFVFMNFAWTGINRPIGQAKKSSTP
jgi:hypothetical protein